MMNLTCNNSGINSSHKDCKNVTKDLNSVAGLEGPTSNWLAKPAFTGHTVNV